MNKNHRIQGLALSILLGLCALVAHAAPDEATGVLKKIRDTGVVTIGYHESTPPFTYVTADGTVMGYSYDIALKLADAIQRDLKLPQLRIKPVPFTTQSRFAVVQNGIVDFVCGATTHTVEREKLVAFSNTIFIAGSRLMVRKNAGIQDFSDLVGKTVTTFAASTSEKILRDLHAQKNYRLRIASTFDRGETPLSLLQTGQADAYMMDDVLLYHTITQAWRPDEWMVTGTPASFEAYGCLLPKDDAALKKLVDREIARLMLSGELALLYRKWLQSPIPPKGINLNMALSEAMQRLFKQPSDQPFN